MQHAQVFVHGPSFRSWSGVNERMAPGVRRVASDETMPPMHIAGNAERSNSSLRLFTSHPSGYIGKDVAPCAYV